MSGAHDSIPKHQYMHQKRRQNIKTQPMYSVNAALVLSAPCRQTIRWSQVKNSINEYPHMHHSIEKKTSLLEKCT